MSLIRWSAELEYNAGTQMWVVTVYRNGHYDHEAAFSYERMARKYIVDVESWE